MEPQAAVLIDSDDEVTPLSASAQSASSTSTPTTTAAHSPSTPRSKKQKTGTRVTTNRDKLFAYLNSFPGQGLVVVSNSLWCGPCHEYLSSNKDSIKKHVNSYVCVFSPLRYLLSMTDVERLLSPCHPYACDHDCRPLSQLSARSIPMLYRNSSRLQRRSAHSKRMGFFPARSCR